MLHIAQNIPKTLPVYYIRIFHMYFIIVLGQNGASGHPGQVDTFTQNTNIDVN